MVRRAGITAVILILLSASNVAAATSTVRIVNFAFKPKSQSVSLGNAVRWTNASSKTHTATPSVNWSWTGVTVSPGASSNAVTPTQAGGFRYFCAIHPTLMRGTINVPMTVSPTAGNTATFFLLTLGTVKAPGVLVHDVFVRQNGGAWQLRVTTANPTSSIFFPKTGTWDMRTRLRYLLGGATSGFSPITTVVVF